MTLSNSLYKDAEDRNIALELAQQYIAAERRPPNLGTGSTSTNTKTTGENEHTIRAQPSLTDKLTHNISTSFKDSESKCSGDIGGCWIEYVFEYKQVTRDYGLTAEQHLQYFHNILWKDMQRYYVDLIKVYRTSFGFAAEMTQGVQLHFWAKPR